MSTSQLDAARAAATRPATRCRYLRRSHDQCTGEAADPNGEILLCPKHLARALELVHRWKKVTAAITASTP